MQKPVHSNTVGFTYEESFGPQSCDPSLRQQPHFWSASLGRNIVTS